MKIKESNIEDDDYKIKMGKIIQKYYFHETPLIKNKLEWLEAIRWGETKLLRKAQINISTRNRTFQQFKTEISLSSNYEDINLKHNGSIKSNFPKQILLDEFCSIYSGDKSVILEKKKARNKSFEISSKKQKEGYIHGLNSENLNKINTNKSTTWKGTWYYLAWYWKSQNSLYYSKKGLSTITYKLHGINPKNTQFTMATSKTKSLLSSEIYSFFKSNTAYSIHNSHKTHEISGHCNYHNMSLTPMTTSNSLFEQTGTFQPSKTPYNLDSHNHIDTLHKFSKHYKHSSFVIKEPSRKEEAARRLADKASFSIHM
jgi:hypothetical protein